MLLLSDKASRRDLLMRSSEGLGSTVLTGLNGDGPARKTSSSMSFF
jgi:hypothetical protein